ncbi:hypothetical protein [Endozoicomonas atrinae]|uniref:hypothetical protein n=1 Tax=Endozoicomonas atrinae TaxID=1333660 RepID=UPI003B002885
MKTDFTATKKTIASAVESANSLNINSLEQAERVSSEPQPMEMKDDYSVSIFDVIDTPDGLKMSHIDIAKGANRRSDNVKRTVEKLAKEGAISTPQIEERQVKGVTGSASTNIHLLLNRLDSITVMAAVNYKFLSSLVARWDELEKRNAKKSVEPVQAEPKDSIDSKYKRIHEIDPDALAKLNPIYQQMLTLAETVNPGQSDYRYAASIATEKLTGFNLLNLFDTPKPSATVTRIKPDAHQSELKLVPKNDQDPRLLGYKRKVTQTYSRTTLRDKGIYGLDNYKSWYELQDVCDMSSKEIREHFVELGLIKLCERSAFSESKKYILTADGWDFGTMYDPVRDEFHGADSKRLLTSDAQPVFGYEVLDLLI